jgi:hypothetical protein
MVVEDVAPLLQVPGGAVERVVIADRHGGTIAKVLGQPGGRTHTGARATQGVRKALPTYNAVRTGE